MSFGCALICLESITADAVTNLQDPNRVFDFFAAIGGAATNKLTALYSELRTPATL